jgi:hypothetical protein
MKKLLVILVLMAVIFGTVSVSAGSSYYVSPTGGNSNSGTITSPWKTISYGASRLSPGDTLYIRGGTYVETLNISVNGTASNPIVISGYPGETAIVDGQYTLPGGSFYNFFVQVSGNYVTLRDITLMRSTGGLAIFTGTHEYGINIIGNGARESGLILAGSYNVFDGCSMTDNGNGYGTGGQGTWGGAIATVGSYTTIQNSISHDNVGEGLATYSNSNNTIIQDSISYNNRSANLYLDSVNTATARRNILYQTKPSNDAYGLTIAAETGQPSNLRIYNNLVSGFFVNFHVDSNVITLNNVDIAYNTFVNSTGDSGSGYNMGVYFRTNINTYTNSRFINNIVVEEGSDKIPVYVESSHPGLTFSHNLWSKTPMSAASGTGDVIGNPMLAKTGSISNPLWYQITSGSPAINKALVLTEVTEDYWKAIRGSSPDIGAHEYQGTTPPVSTSTFTPIVTKTSTVVPVNTSTPTRTSTIAPTKTSTPITTPECITVTFKDNTKIIVCKP